MPISSKLLMLNSEKGVTHHLTKDLRLLVAQIII